MNKLYLSYDGDGCGKKVGRAIIANDEKALHDISAKIDLGHQIVNHWVAEHGGKVISGGGDEGSFKVPKDAVKDIERLRKDHEYSTGITISVGVGESLSECGRALLAAKFRGKNQTAFYGEDVEKDINDARKRVKKGKASQEEYKLAEAYLEKSEGKNMADKKPEASKEAPKKDDKQAAPAPESSDCKYCEESDGTDPDHCKYCHDADVAAEEAACPYCQEQDQANADGAGEDCQYCKDADDSAQECPYCKDAGFDPHVSEQDTKIQSPDSNNASAPAGSPEEKAQANEMGMNPPTIGKPEMGNNSSPVGEGQANPMDNTAGAPVAPASADAAEMQGNDAVPPAGVDVSEGAHSKEAMQAIATQIQSETIDGKPDDKAQANNIDDTSIVGDQTEGNVSRPEGFGSAVPGDMGLDANHPVENNKPDLSAVLREGLDVQSSSIQKDKVVNMVSQSLQQFKNAKMALENSKLQDPTLYNASIMMLKAMIELCKLAGLDNSGGAEAQGEQVIGELQGGAPTDEWSDPFPKHPDQGGVQKPGHAAPSEGAAGAGKSRAPIGQPIGKLPQKATTHVARTPLPPGAINAKGQQKVIDPKTGETRFIDRKKGMVQSPTGVPVKPPSRGNDGEPQA